MKYYNLLKAWHKDDDNDFYFINSHDKAAAVRDGSKWRDSTKRPAAQDGEGASQLTTTVNGAVAWGPTGMANRKRWPSGAASHLVGEGAGNKRVGRPTCNVAVDALAATSVMATLMRSPFGATKKSSRPSPRQRGMFAP